MSSTRTRLSLRARCFAMASTCLATFGGKVTLRRTCLARGCFVRARFAIAIVAPVYTIVVHIAECRTHPFAKSAKRVGHPAIMGETEQQFPTFGRQSERASCVSRSRK